ncbi:MAG TPA: metal-dependent hydrolase, partial [Patescibacteria group bacterium]|nr:metal-dependent hydrolase [Patescibacteria group bacterium]
EKREGRTVLKKILVCATFFLLLLSSTLVAAAGAGDSAGGDRVTLTYYGQSAFMLSHGGTQLIFDPYLSKSLWKAADADEIECQYILVSHGHQDHLGDTVSIAKRTGAKAVTFNALAGMLKEQGCDVAPMDIGGQRAFDFGYVKLTPAIHGSGVPGGMAVGFIVNFFGKTIYFAGDTALFGDMAFIARNKVDYALLPIGGNYTMGIADAADAVGLIKPQAVIPVHYNTNPLIKASPEEFKGIVEKRYGIPVRVMQPGGPLFYRE